MIKLKKQSSLATAIIILIVVVLIVAGGVGYYFYKEKKGSKVELREGIKYEYTRTFQEKERVFLEIYVTKETDKEWSGIITSSLFEEREICLMRFKINKDNLNLSFTSPLEAGEVLKENVDYQGYQELEEPYNALFYPFYMVMLLLSQEAIDINEFIEQGFIKIEEQNLFISQPLVHDGFRAYKITAEHAPTFELFISTIKPYLLIELPSDYGVLKLKKIEKKTFNLSEYTGLEVCEKVANRDECYTKFAIETKDSSLCEKITDSAERAWCYANFAQGTKEDVSLCEKITDTYKKNRCYTDIALKTKDGSLCEKVTAGKDWCYRNIAVEIKDSGLCEKVTNNIERHICYVLVTNDISICEELTDSFGKSKCYWNVAIETKDTSLCERTKDKNSCYTNVAEEAQDSSLCEKITDVFAKDTCYLKLAPIIKEAGLCEKITANAPKDSCYVEVALQTKNSSLCEKITSSAKKDRCLKYFGISP